MIYIIDGAGVLRFGKEEVAVTTGTVIACRQERSILHQLINTGDKELRYLVVSTMEFPDLCEYPTLIKLAPMRRRRLASRSDFGRSTVKDTNVNYYEGEDGKEIERVKRSGTKT